MPPAYKHSRSAKERLYCQLRRRERSVRPLESDSPATSHPQGFATRQPSRWLRLGQFAGLLALAVICQWRNNAFQSEFGRHSDEAAHYVTGLMVHDFLRSFDLMHPVSFAENYYLHYPKVAIGHWGPVFYIVQATWNCVFGSSRISLMLLMAATTTAVAYTLSVMCEHRLGQLGGVIMGATLVLSPGFQLSTASLMTEPLSALLILWAAIVWGDFMARPQLRSAAAFGAIASLATLTKGTGLLLAFIPPLSLVFSGNYRLARQPQFWAPAAIVACVCGPWYALTLSMQRNGMQSEAFSFGFTVQAIPFYTRTLAEIAGPLWLLCAGCGCFFGRMRGTGDCASRRAAMAALLAGAMLFHCVTPCGLEARHLSVAVAPLLFFAAEAVGVFSRALQQHRVVGAASLISLGMLLLMMATSSPASGQTLITSGFGEVVDAIEGMDISKRAVLLISSDELGDGMFVAEVAKRDQRPSRFALRASKTLASSRWNGSGYRLRFETTEEVKKWLDSAPVTVVVLDESIGHSSRREHGQLRRIVEESDGEWRLAGSFALTRQGRLHPHSVAVFTHSGRAHEGAKRIELDLSEMIGRTIRLSREFE